MKPRDTLPDRRADDPAPWRWRQAWPWAVLLLLLGVAQTLLVALTLRAESARAQDAAESVAAESAVELRRQLMQLAQRLQALRWPGDAASDWRGGGAALLRTQPGLRRIERRSEAMGLQDELDTPFTPRLFDRLSRDELLFDARAACASARRAAAPGFSRSYYVPLGNGEGLEVLDLCVPLQDGGHDAGFVVGTVALGMALESAAAALPARPGRGYEVSLVEPDGTRLARVGGSRGAGVFVADRVVDLPGGTLVLRADSVAGQPGLIPNLATALVLGLSIALFAVVLLLARDVRRRARAERALAEALAFRQAMEDSLSTGLRARDLDGAISYVNPAFCAMVGFSAGELVAPTRPRRAGEDVVPPYWPPEQVELYRARQQQRLRLDPGRGIPREAREGYETVFMRKNGERFPVMIYEAPLVDGRGRHTGWMSAVVDVSAQRRVEEIARQQQDRLQATARLATVGEMASLLSHELNQPLAAIASYASGSLNLLDHEGPAALAPAELGPMLRQALARIAEQAERAGRIIKSVHGFVRRREQQHETLPASLLIESVLPLVRLQARKSGTRIEVDLPAGPGPGPSVRCDRTMLEQVLMNLARNGIQAMEQDTSPEDRVLMLRVRQTHERWVTFSVVDAGPGIAPDVAQRLFTPFFTTRAEGMGLGLSLCRTVIEQHGGALDFGPAPGRRGTEFRFTLPAPRPAKPETLAP